MHGSLLVSLSISPLPYIISRLQLLLGSSSDPEQADAISEAVLMCYIYSKSHMPVWCVVALEPHMTRMKENTMGLAILPVIVNVSVHLH